MFLAYDHLRAGRERYEDLLREAARQRRQRAAGLATRERPNRLALRRRSRLITGRPRGRTGDPAVTGDPRREPAATVDRGRWAGE